MEERFFFPLMAKIDFSALKSADLRSVAPIGEGLRPTGSSTGGASTLGTSVQTGSFTPTAVSAQAPAPVAPQVQKPLVSPVGKKISLAGLRSGTQPKIQETISSPVSESVPTSAPSTVGIKEGNSSIAQEVPVVPLEKPAGEALSSIETPSIHITKPVISQAPALTEEVPVEEMPPKIQDS